MRPSRPPTRTRPRSPATSAAARRSASDGAGPSGGASAGPAPLFPTRPPPPRRRGRTPAGLPPAPPRPAGGGGGAGSRDLGPLVPRADIEVFLSQGAGLLEDRRYEEWLDLFAEDVRYWMPMRRNVPADEPAREFTREGADVNWFDEGKDT